MLARKYVAFNIAEHAKSKYSSFFVLFSAVGMTSGPGLALVLGIRPKIEIFGRTVHEYCYVSWIMVFVWTIFGILFYKFFKEPKKLSPLTSALLQKVNDLDAETSNKIQRYYQGNLRCVGEKESAILNGSSDFNEQTRIMNEIRTEGANENRDEDPIIETLITDNRGRPLLPPRTYPKVVVNKFSNKIFFFLVSVLYLIKVRIIVIR